MRQMTFRIAAMGHRNSNLHVMLQNSCWEVSLWSGVESGGFERLSQLCRLVKFVNISSDFRAKGPSETSIRCSAKVLWGGIPDVHVYVQCAVRQELDF